MIIKLVISAVCIAVGGMFWGSCFAIAALKTGAVAVWYSLAAYGLVFVFRVASGNMSEKKFLRVGLEVAVDAFASAVALYTVMVATGVVNVTACFKEGTIVIAEEGEKKIEDLEVGDSVWSYDEETGEMAFKKVLRLFRNGKEYAKGDKIDEEGGTNTWVHVKINGETITSTPGHKYYLPDNVECREIGERHEHASYEGLSVKWVSACNLKKVIKYCFLTVIMV
jgi:hypothetical protein